jgi:hypothetical protein
MPARRYALALLTLLPLCGQDRPVAPAPAAPVAPTRKDPQFIEGKMTVSDASGGYSAPGKATKDAVPQKVNATYALSIPAGAKVKVELLGRKRSFKVFFIGADMGRTFDPGLTVNRILGRPDASFYENRTQETKGIYCVVTGLEPMVDEPYKLIFTDF